MRSSLVVSPFGDIINRRSPSMLGRLENTVSSIKFLIANLSNLKRDNALPDLQLAEVVVSSSETVSAP